MADYEKGLNQFLDQKYPQVFTTIREKKTLDDDLKATLGQAFEAYQAIFV